MLKDPARAPRRAARPTPTLRGALLLAALSPLVLPACSRPGDNGTTAAADTHVAGGVRARELPKVRVAPVERREMVQVLETMTKLESEREIELYPRSSGVVVRVLAEEGDRVEADQVLAEMDDRDEVLAVDDARVAHAEAQNTQEVRELAAKEAEARVESARLAADQAERDYQRNLALFEGAGDVASALSEQALEASLLERDRALNEHRLAELAHERAVLDAKLSRTATDRAQVALDRAELALSHKRLTAPFAGVVARRDVRVGDTIGTAAPAFVLSDVDALRAVFNRPQEERARFTGGLDDAASGGSLSIEAEAEAVPGVTFPGRVVRVSPTIEPESGQFRVTATLDDGEAVGGAELLPGMLVRMRIVTDRHPDVLVVPKRALRREGERRHVLVAERDAGSADGLDATVRRVEVREGYDDEESIEVVPVEGEDLAADDLVVVIGSRDLEEGDPVRLDEARALGADDVRPRADDALAPATAGEPARSADDDARPADAAEADDDATAAADAGDAAGE